MGEELLRQVRLRRHRSTIGGNVLQALEEFTEEWEKTSAKLGELTDWLASAAIELRGAAPGDPRRDVYARVEADAKRLEKELEDIELKQEATLSAILEESGPLTLQLEDGTTRTLAARANTAGGVEALLPRDFLAVWRVCSVFSGSVVLGGQATRLKFGDKNQVATVKFERKKKVAKKDAVIGEEVSLFGKE
jgi:hypothetical protein